MLRSCALVFLAILLSACQTSGERSPAQVKCVEIPNDLVECSEVAD